MRLPRRVPWASLSELEQICAWVYTDENDLDAKVLAINRLSAWRATTTLPHALESALSILAVILQDKSQSVPASLLSIRQSYSTALIRLVNGLVDPLQLGAYARSIASIANQLGLPSWLVELRHAATHEDLPSIDLLREAARESMAWLLHNYFLPTINPSVAPEACTPLRSLDPVLKEYKKFLKITTRDASLRTQHKAAILSVLKDVERWIAEAKVAATLTTRNAGWEMSTLDMLSDVDPKERWALEKLCDALLEKGSLVPLSKNIRKRNFPMEAFLPPKLSVHIWTPLLQHLQSLHSEFYLILVGRIISTLLPENGSEAVETPSSYDASYDMCLARWAKWSIEAYAGNESATGFDLRREVTIVLMQSFGHIEVSPPRDGKAAASLLESLCDGVPELEDTLTTLRFIAFDVRPSDVRHLISALPLLIQSP
ncbi:hypothetical protein H0H87_010167 [Tephrocybe sp. NHM501043]|nr:hypothetical protein H0H87_010167 [Tephrocybe sp. NHM501043]